MDDDAILTSRTIHRYFSHGAHQGVSVFLRQSSTTEGSRGARLSALGILLDVTLCRPRPWIHVEPLQAALKSIHESSENADPDWTPAQSYFDQHMHSPNKPFSDWPTEMSLPGSSPTIRIPYFLHYLGPSSITLFKFLIARRRVLIYTPPPVKSASELCHLAVDLVYTLQIRHSREAVKVLGLITLSDIDELSKEDRRRGWIACTTDIMITEKLQLYDLLIDLSGKRPAFKVSTERQTLTRVSFTWTDIGLVSLPDNDLSPTNIVHSGENFHLFCPHHRHRSH